MAKWRNGSGGSAAGLYTLVMPEVTGSIPGVSHEFRFVRIMFPASLIKQSKSNGTLSQVYAQTYIRGESVSVHSG